MEGFDIDGMNQRAGVGTATGPCFAPKEYTHVLTCSAALGWKGCEFCSHNRREDRSNVAPPHVCHNGYRSFFSTESQSRTRARCMCMHGLNVWPRVS